MRPLAPFAAGVLVLVVVACETTTLDFRDGGDDDDGTTPLPAVCFDFGTICSLGATDVATGGSAYHASFGRAGDLARAADGSLLIADALQSRIRRITAAGTIVDVAGSGFRDPVGNPDLSPALEADLDAPGLLAVCPDGWLIFARDGGVVIWGVDPASGLVRHIAGSALGGPATGPAATAQFGDVDALACDADSNLFVADWANHVISAVNRGTSTATLHGVSIPAGEVRTVAGTGVQGTGADGVPGISSALDFPTGIVARPDGALWILDGGNGRLRRLTAGGIVEALRGGTLPDASADVDVAQDLIVVAGPHGVFASVLSTGASVTFGSTTVPANGDFVTIAGEPDGFEQPPLEDGGPALLQRFHAVPGAVLGDGGDVLVTEGSGLLRRIRRVDGTMSVIAGYGGAPSIAEHLASPSGIAIAPGSDDLLLAGGAHLWRFDSDGGPVTVIAGSRLDLETSPAGGNALSVGMETRDVTTAADGTVYVLDDWNGKVWSLDVERDVVDAVAGGGNAEPDAGGPALFANLYEPMAIAVDTAGRLFMCNAEHAVFAVNLGSVSTTVATVTLAPDAIDLIAGTRGVPGAIGNGGPALAAEFRFSDGCELLVHGPHLYVADRVNEQIRRIHLTTGIIDLFAGGGTEIGDGFPPLESDLQYVHGMAVYGGDLYWGGTEYPYTIDEELGFRVRRTPLSGTEAVETIAGDGVAGFHGDFAPAVQAQLGGPVDIAFAPDGVLLIVDANHRVRRVEL